MIMLMIRTQRREPSSRRESMAADHVVEVGNDVNSDVLSETRISQSTRNCANTNRASLARTRSRTSWASHARNIRKRTVSSRITPSSKDYPSGWTRLKVRNTCKRLLGIRQSHQHRTGDGQKDHT